MHPFPLQLAGPEIFDRLRGLFQKAGFSEERVCKALGIGCISEVGQAAQSREIAQLAEAPDSPFQLLVRLFPLLQNVPDHEVLSRLSSTELAALQEAGLLRQGAPAPAGCWWSPVFLYPVSGWILASDRPTRPDGQPLEPAEDVVFPAIYPGTLRFLKVISLRPAEEGLDLCAGSGVGALQMSRAVARVVSADLTGRAAQFAEFNRRLNGCPSLEVATGDLYEAVRGRRFDRITAHPPYVPSLGPRMIYRDGGETGESVLQRIMEGLPGHLRPGGRFYSVCMGMDTEAAPFEERARRWLGPSAEEFDLLFVEHRQRSPMDVAVEIGMKAKNPGYIPELMGVFQQHRATALAYGALVVARHAAPRKGSVHRVRFSEWTTASDIDRWLDVEEACGGDEAADLNDRTFAPVAECRLQVTHAFSREEGFVPALLRLQCDQSFRCDLEVEPWVAQLLTCYEHGKTLRQVHGEALQAGLLPLGFGMEALGRLTLRLFQQGFLEEPVSGQAARERGGA